MAESHATGRELEPAWRDVFNRRAETFGGSVRTSDYFNERSFLLYRKTILEWLGPVHNQTVLDAGCGVGAFAEPLVAKNSVYGTDCSEKSLEFAAKRGLRITCTDLLALPFGPAEFDLILCISVLQHFAEPRDVLRELARVLKPGGMLVVATLNQESLQRRLLGLVQRSTAFTRMYTVDELRNVYTSLGIENTEFLHLYFPWTHSARHQRPGLFPRLLSTTFAICGRKG